MLAEDGEGGRLVYGDLPVQQSWSAGHWLVFGVFSFSWRGTYQAKAVSIAMRGPRASGYFGISQAPWARVVCVVVEGSRRVGERSLEVVFESAPAEPTMLVAGVTAGEELCVVVENGSADQRGALVTAESCGMGACVYC